MSDKPVHNPPSCTCARILWMGKHCAAFHLNVNGDHGDLWAFMADGVDDDFASSFPIDDLPEIIGECFALMWEAWVPPEGSVKIG